jgi:hypothetical protein
MSKNIIITILTLLLLATGSIATYAFGGLKSDWGTSFWTHNEADCGWGFGSCKSKTDINIVEDSEHGNICYVATTGAGYEARYFNPVSSISCVKK